MPLRLIVVGKKSSMLDDFESRFYKRIRAWSKFEIIELKESRAKTVAQRKKQEAEKILQQSQRFILFDEHGQNLGSKQWASFIEKQTANACLDWVIGGADGVDDSIKQKAHATWALSKLTLPHQLVRVTVVEQLYRALTIMKGHPYHRS
ncbi:MAG: 23S rRNA (pseudouridine(1915)-N(3))-methyltransferase RlmH [Mariprofundaceae bacterium]|nr:23S rRNA (pseudouridine(1915)-N(3))-methyltransferase RlmH [Mariprofundaceae bacterium]